MIYTDRDLGIMAEIIRDFERLNTNYGINIKFTNSGFGIYYIVAANIDYKDSPMYRECLKNANEVLDNVEKSLKKLFKEKTKKVLEYKKEDQKETIEMQSPTLNRYYIRIFRSYSFKEDK